MDGALSVDPVVLDGLKQRKASLVSWLSWPSVQALWFYERSRQAHLAGNAGRAQLLRTAGRFVSGVEISPTAQIGERFTISHGHGIVIGDAIIGDDCRVLQGVTIGRAGFDEDTGQPSAYPRIGDRVTIYAGAVIVGDVSIGDEAVIGANAVVTRDVPAGVTVGGVPARPIGR